MARSPLLSGLIGASRWLLSMNTLSSGHRRHSSQCQRRFVLLRAKKELALLVVKSIKINLDILTALER